MREELGTESRVEVALGWENATRLEMDISDILMPDQRGVICPTLAFFEEEYRVFMLWSMCGVGYVLYAKPKVIVSRSFTFVFIFLICWHALVAPFDMPAWRIPDDIGSRCHGNWSTVPNLDHPVHASLVLTGHRHWDGYDDDDDYDDED